MVYSTSLYLQMVQVAMGETTAGARGVFVPMAEGETPPPKVAAATSTASTRCKGQHQHKLERDAATTCNSNHQQSLQLA